MSLLAQLLTGAKPTTVIEDEWQARSDTYASVQPKILDALTALGSSTPREIGKRAGINITSVHRSLRRLQDNGQVTCVREADHGAARIPSLWAVVTDPPQPTDVPCEACGAAAGAWCMNTRKQQRKQLHRVRITTYKEARK